MNDLAGREIDDNHGIIAQLRNEQPVANGIEGHVIDPAADVSERDLGLQAQRLRVYRLRAGMQHAQEHPGGGSERGTNDMKANGVHVAGHFGSGLGRTSPDPARPLMFQRLALPRLGTQKSMHSS